MALTHTKTLSILAPAKVNLYLHVIDRRADGLHLLDSLVAFADIGDHVKIESAPEFDFAVKGPFANSFALTEQSSYADSENIVVRAAHGLANLSGNKLDCKITLTKNLPIASGIGGGSSDAAACIWGLMKRWGVSPQAPFLNDLLLALGADVPVCFSCQATVMRGIGEELMSLKVFPETPILLINPRVSCSTAEIFRNLNVQKGEYINVPEQFNDVYALSEFLHQMDNHMYSTALTKLPVLADVINALQAQDECLVTRMSGSGATCFALFPTDQAAAKAAEKIAIQHPGWWVKSGWLGRPERY
ncbi:MAG: 4-(cytidine 5'-diphospho)-2-C-methyl-D-erythritol kinase [Pseudomonadota bacterium]|jgi:4-diphosphocytidyl-2-C-methyl-D-erythritol kinase|nr:4-(cytidine 5'-diphospho)-2-C-methyl-D-erythritol kinase [Alphaproteobacteria bacterium]MEC7701619.1 4-(cytidine 5'-diphospho)-2-C-methyl-D-erythritol kinase [Pseudomonadota bacterium]MEE3323473.1 4-(cytidine 5'-diphospho)-2-C-methyl-D-erythritol kinase [Pseudomonadota bacterium]|tara:strand:- start:552 stop:1460 length:909 start_codon:yes stop_codon:yes gene_type:complete